MSKVVMETAQKIRDFREAGPGEGPFGQDYLKAEWTDYMRDEEGLATVEVVLILLVLIALVLIFKKQITKVLKSLMSKVSSQSDGV